MASYEYEHPNTLEVIDDPANWLGTNVIYWVFKENPELIRIVYKYWHKTLPDTMFFKLVHEELPLQYMRDRWLVEQVELGLLDPEELKDHILCGRILETLERLSQVYADEQR